MAWNRRTWTTLAALSGLIGVAAGAFAAHGLAAASAKELVRTGSSYQLIHALATLSCSALVGAGAPRAHWAAPLFLLGTLLFCGSLYALAAGAPHVVGAITPIGGLAFLTGWLVLAWAALDIDVTGRRP